MCVYYFFNFVGKFLSAVGSWKNEQQKRKLLSGNYESLAILGYYYTIQKQVYIKIGELP